LSRAKRDNVALATTRRASIADARHPLSPTTFEKPAFKAGFFSSVVKEDENLRRRFEPSEARQRCFSNGPQGKHRRCASSSLADHI